MHYELLKLLFVVVAWHVAYQLMDGGLGHCVIGAFAGVQVVTTVKAVCEGLGIGNAAYCCIKVYAAIKDW